MELHRSYWTHATGGVLRSAVEDYLQGRPMDAETDAAMRAYLRQWSCAEGFTGPEIEALRTRVNELTSSQAIDPLLLDALLAGAGPP